MRKGCIRMENARVLLIVFGIVLIFVGIGFLFWALRITLKRQKGGEATTSLTTNDPALKNFGRPSWWQRNNQLVLFLLATVFLMLGIGGLSSIPSMFK
ncbi:hypothetical protein FA947_01175 [Mycoplasmoides pneumoniae]|nr:hypothetical protein B7R95_01190 [Mycoplasmoides pneumoniae]CAG7571087.1 New ORF [Mycoplasmoides pneumoniae M129]ARI12261.1 hypothetical protein B7R97_01190 [Mycoplasmoides pneumoniae]ARI12965.1 hypothetical protein B7R98_01190 [Mycoplasmoides pneumoniae]ARI14140.1 hypothetical protein B7R99_01190 [Mycoplasmoides pneumoniae]